jgi:hypothetical protein
LPGRAREPLALESVAVAVGQFFAHVERLGVPAVSGREAALAPFCEVPYVFAAGVGYSERE